MDKVTRQCPQTTTFLKRKESRSGIEPRSYRLLGSNAVTLGQTGSLVHSTWLSDYIIYTCREWSSSPAAHQSWLVCSCLPCWCPLRVSVTDQLQQSRELISARKTSHNHKSKKSHKQQQKHESPTVTLTQHAKRRFVGGGGGGGGYNCKVTVCTVLCAGVGNTIYRHRDGFGGSGRRDFITMQ